jgi:hypothetical protein
MQVRLAILREVKIDNDIHRLNINSTSEEVRANKVAAHAVSEVMEDAVAVRLEHLCVGVETGVSELSHLFGKELDTVRGITENNGLVDLQLMRGC